MWGYGVGLYKLIRRPGHHIFIPNRMKYDRQAILTTITDRSHMMVTTEKVFVEIQDGWRKYAERIRNV